ncbi:MAG: NAAT family transporter [Gammaproteobacteria bacterium]|nr:NAAT family transporter [Gammaproteobacteria bacterium]
MNLYTMAITLFLVMNALGNVPVFISSLQHIKPKRRAWVIIREALFAFAILATFVFAGHAIMKGLQIIPSALSISGGIILFIIALRLIFPAANVKEEKPEGEPFLVPLAIPLFAGPATMATIILMTNQAPDETWLVVSALSIAWFASVAILLAGSILSKYLGKRGIIAIERLMGMILMTISIQMLLGGIQQYFHLAH